MRAGIMIVIEVEPGHDDGPQVSMPAIGCSAEIIRRLARMNLALHHDQYLLLADPDGRPYPRTESV
jgi:hypothetical protein